MSSYDNKKSNTEKDSRVTEIIELALRLSEKQQEMFLHIGKGFEIANYFADQPQPPGGNCTTYRPVAGA